MAKKKESEKKIERKLKKRVEEEGGMCIKFLPYMFNGFPDRICLFPGGVCIFVETKSEDDKPRKLQLFIHRKLRKLGFNVYIIDKEEQIETMILNG